MPGRFITCTAVVLGMPNTFMATSAACIAGVPELVFSRMVRSGNSADSSTRWLRKTGTKRSNLCTDGLV
ncbi:Uncharacterised protein [Mycobacterium tuberculosis]|nr:Uncharacterised protein [Mycobacterium tuberculosis]CKN36488.1 Uncharacterised protein [Mycobacterium tuberculosis]